VDVLALIAEPANDASREVEAERSVVCVTIGSSLGSLPRYRRTCFHAQHESPRPTVCSRPLSLERILLLRFSSSEFLHSRASLIIFRCELDLPRVPSLFATPLVCVHSPRGLPRPSLRSVLRLSQSPDGFLRIRARRLISSFSHVQGRPVQGLLFSPSHPSSSEGACPRAVGPVSAHRPKSAATLTGPRLRGFDPSEDTFQRLSYSPLRRSFPSSSFSPPGPLSRRVPQLTQGTPLMMLNIEPSRRR
jgi:hypothetical protein